MGGRPCPDCGWSDPARPSWRSWLPFAVIPLAIVAVGSVPVVLGATRLGTSGPGEQTIAVSSPAPADADPTELLLADVPGFERINPVPEHKDGLSLEEAANLDTETAAEQRARLTELGYQGGAINWWASPDQRIMFITVFEFASPYEASSYIGEHRLRVASDDSVTSLAIPVPGAVGWGYPSGKAFGYEVMFAKGHRLYHLVHVDRSGARTGQDEISSIAAEQYRRG